MIRVKVKVALGEQSKERLLGSENSSVKAGEQVAGAACKMEGHRRGRSHIVLAWSLAQSSPGPDRLLLEPHPFWASSWRRSTGAKSPKGCNLSRN